MFDNTVLARNTYLVDHHHNEVQLKFVRELCALSGFAGLYKLPTLIKNTSLFNSLPRELILDVASCLEATDFLNAIKAIPSLAQAVNVYESQTVKRIVANSRLLSARVDSKRHTVLDDIMDPMHPGESTVILQHLLEDTPKFEDLEHDILEGAPGLAQYSKFFRRLRFQYILNNRANDDWDSEQFGVSDILEDLTIHLTNYGERLLQEMRAVYDILAKRIEDADNKFDRPLIHRRMQHGQTGLTVPFQQNLTDTMISGMDFLPGDSERTERCGPAEVFYEGAMRDTNTGFFSESFKAAAKSGECRRVEMLEEKKWDFMNWRLAAGWCNRLLD